jgi:hypothetical protein
MSGCSPVCPHVSAAEWLGGFLLKIVVILIKVGGTLRFV